jgi:SAM-dependent methyltransferase
MPVPYSSKRRKAEIYRGTARLAQPAPHRHPLVRMLTDFSFTSRVIRFGLGLPVPLETEDRWVLEQVIFQYFMHLPDLHRILFVGCDWYTKHYERMFFRNRDYWTIDASPKARRFGARRHLVAPLEELDRNFAAEYFDVIFCNGVYGFGLDAAPALERAIEMCWSRLRPLGHFVFGWNDIPARTPVPLDAIAALRRFSRFEMPNLNTWRYLTDTPYRHTYDFYIKADA